MFLLILIILLFFYFIFAENKENFLGTYSIPWATRISRPTRNMNYDLRGEEYFPPLLNLPFDNSSIEPIPVPELINKRNIYVL